MSSAVVYARPARAGTRSPGAAPRAGSWRLPALSVIAFAMIAMLACLRFASLESHPSFPRVAGLVLTAGGLGAALLWSGSARLPARTASLLRLAFSGAALYLALRCAGFAAHELWPTRWGSLFTRLSHGSGRLDGLWPYRGSSPDARLAIMACLPAAVVPAAALAFWPGERAASRRHLAALALLLALYVVAAANESRRGWQVQGLVILLALYAWGWSSRTRRAEDGRAAAWLLLGALVAIVTAGAVAGGPPLIDVRAWQPFGEPGATTAFDWNQTYGPLRWSSSSAEMVGVSAAAPHLWRAAELDRFDGTRFLASGHAPAEAPALAARTRNRRWVSTTRFTVHALASRRLLSPGEILGVRLEDATGPGGPTVSGDGTAITPRVLPGASGYVVRAYVPEPSGAEMRRAPAAVPAAQAAYVRFELPAGPGRTREVTTGGPAGRRLIEASPYAGVYRLARRLAAGAGGNYEKARRIEAYLLGGRLTYDTRPPLSRYPIVAFLLRERRGYCQQFSAAMALMLRMDGVPARIGSGFLPGTRAGAAYTVRGPDAHAWVEVFFPGIGWVTFDPTPPPRRLAPAGSGGGAQLTPGRLAARPRASSSRATALRGAAGAHGAGGAAGPPAIGALIALALVGAGVALLALRRLRRAGSPGEDGAAAVEELRRALRRLGAPPAPAITLAELERLLARSHGEAAARYVRSLLAIRYRPAADGAAPSARERRLLRRALTAGRGPRGWLLGMLALPPRRPHRGSWPASSSTAVDSTSAGRLAPPGA